MGCSVSRVDDESSGFFLGHPDPGFKDHLCVAERGAEAEVQHVGPVRGAAGEDGYPVELVQGRGRLRHPVR